MNNTGLMIINHSVPCECACAYCFFQSRKASSGVPYEMGERLGFPGFSYLQINGIGLRDAHPLQ